MTYEFRDSPLYAPKTPSLEDQIKVLSIIDKNQHFKVTPHQLSDRVPDISAIHLSPDVQSHHNYYLHILYSTLNSPAIDYLDGQGHEIGYLIPFQNREHIHKIEAEFINELEDQDDKLTAEYIFQNHRHAKNRLTKIHTALQMLASELHNEVLDTIIKELPPTQIVYDEQTSSSKIDMLNRHEETMIKALNYLAATYPANQ
ncbi:hypothetical protein A2W24_06730 [Microgenomates group bacterium RBG_16_45_19]|nr:MAG: hypothetical protein A2W24_06730 [Microgenomates group bacterium RBG_16_45_19]